jgi:hypothetical protein
MSLIQFSVGINDAVGKHATTRFYANVASGATLAETAAGVAPFLGLLNGVTAGRITGCYARVPMDISGLTPNTPTGAVYVRSVGALSWPNAADTHPWEFVIPAIAAALVSGDTLVQTEGGAIDVLTDLMGAAFTVHSTGDSTFTDEDGNNLVLEPRGFHTFRKFGRNVRRGRGSVGV